MGNTETNKTVKHKQEKNSDSNNLSRLINRKTLFKKSIKKIHTKPLESIEEISDSKLESESFSILESKIDNFTWKNVSNHKENDSKYNNKILKINGENIPNPKSNEEFDQIGELVFENGDVYRGRIFEFMAHGEGEMKYENGCKYKGHFFRGKKEGEGKFRFSNGNKYIGSFRNDLFHGKGKFKYNDGTIYKGKSIQVDSISNQKDPLKMERKMEGEKLCM